MSSVPPNESISDEDEIIQHSPFPAGRNPNQDESHSPAVSDICTFTEPEKKESLHMESTITSPAVFRRLSFDDDVRPVVVMEEQNECNVCFAVGTSSNAIAKLNCSFDMMNQFRDIEFIDPDNQICYKLVENAFQKAKETQMELLDEKVTLRCCYKCRSQLGACVSNSVRARKVREKKRRSIMDRFKCNSVGTRTETRSCNLKGLSACSVNAASFSRPIILATYSVWFGEHWSKGFALKAGVSLDCAASIFENPTGVLLCERHRAMAKNVALSTVAELHSCSICGNVGEKRASGRVTSMDWQKISENVEVRCVMEDAVALFTDNRVYAGEIQRLCDVCRLVVCRGLDMRSNSVAGGSLPFDYGRSRRAVRRSIAWVRDRLPRNRKTNVDLSTHVVFLSDAFKRYREFVIETGEQSVALTQARDLRRYLQPPLAASGIFCEKTESKRVGYYFCTHDTFRQLAMEAAGTKKDRVSMSIADEERELDGFGDYICSRKVDIDRFTWKLEEFIQAIGQGIWMREVLLAASERMLRRCRSSARLQRRSYMEIWPCNSEECPPLSDMTQHDLTFIISLYYSIETRVFRRSGHTIRGPLLTSLSLVGMNAASISFMALFNRVGCAVSYPVLEEMRKAAILKRKEEGDFGSIDRRCFISCAIDNVNIRTGHSMGIFGSTNLGFDGLAMQVVNSRPGDDYRAFCDSQPLQSSLVSTTPVGTRDDFIERVIPDPNQSPNIIGFRHLAVGLAVAQTQYH